jgi:putative spermidine/putrescine transport system permease protein
MLPQRARLSGIAWRTVLYCVPGTFLAVVLGVPVFWIVRLSFGYPGLDLRSYIDLSEGAAHLRVVSQTATIAAIATALALMLGYPIAFIMARLRSPWRQVSLCLVSLPLWTSLLVRTYAWMIILGPDGPINRLLIWSGIAFGPIDLVYNRTGAIIGLTHSVLPYLILPIFASILKLDPMLVRAAGSLGARPATVFVRVILPLSMPGVMAGCVVAFLLGLGAFVIPALLGGPSERSIAMLIENTANQRLNWNLAAALAMELLAASLLIIFVQHRLLGLGSLFGSDIPYDRLGRRLRPIVAAWRRTTERLRWKTADQSARISTRCTQSQIGAGLLDSSMRVISGVGFLFLALPLAIVVPVSFSSGQYLRFPPPGFSLQWYERYLTDLRWLSATGLSLIIGLMVVASSIVIGTLAAIGVARSKSRLSVLLAAGCLSPMMLPNMIIALGLFFAFARMHLVGTVFGLVLAHTLLALPFVFVTVTAGLRELDPNLERAASVLGARPIEIVLRVVTPLLRPFLLTAALFAFIISFDEIVVALFLTSVSVHTLPKMMWENITMFVDPTISSISVILIAISSLLVLAGQKLQGSRPRRL